MSDREHTGGSSSGDREEVDLLLEEGLALYRRGELLAAVAEWETALELDPQCGQARQYIEFVERNFDLLDESFNRDDDGQAPAGDGSFALDSVESSGQIRRPIDVNKVITSHLSSGGPTSRAEHSVDPESADGWYIGLIGDDDGPEASSDALASAAKATKKLDPAILDGVLPRPEDDDLLHMARESRSKQVPDLAPPSPSRPGRPERPDNQAAAVPAADNSHLPAGKPTPSARDKTGDSGRRPSASTAMGLPPMPPRAPRSPLLPSPPMPGVPAPPLPPSSTRAAGQDSRPTPATPPAPQLPSLPGATPIRAAGGRAERRPRTEEIEEEKTIERQNFPLRKPQSRLDDELTPLPEMPGEGALTVGSNPDLDDAWTLDLGLDASSWGSPDSASLPTLAAPDAELSGTISSEMGDEATGEIAVESPDVESQGPADSGHHSSVITSGSATVDASVNQSGSPATHPHEPPLSAPSELLPETLETVPARPSNRTRPRRPSTPRIESSFEVEALTGPGDPPADIAPILIEEAATFDLADETRANDSGPDAGFFEPMSDDPDFPSGPVGFGPAGFGPDVPDPASGGGGVAEEIRLELPDTAPHALPGGAAGRPSHPDRPIGSVPIELASSSDDDSDAMATQPMDLDDFARHGASDLSRDPGLSRKPDTPSRKSAASSSSSAASPSATSSSPDDPSSSPLDRVSQALLTALDHEAPAQESPRQRLRRRVSSLIEKARAAHQDGDRTTAVLALDLAVSEDPDSAITQKLIQLHRDEMCEIFQSYLGDAGGVPVMALGLAQLSNQNIDNRAAFLLSRIDGMLTIDELLDVSGMPRVEAYRHLCVLVIKGILKIDT